MTIGWIDVLIVGVGVAIFAAPLLAGYWGYGDPGRRRKWFKSAVYGLAALQLAILVVFAITFAAQKYRHVNHLKWLAPLVLVDLLMWTCGAAGFVAAAWRHRMGRRPLITIH